MHGKTFLSGSEVRCSAGVPRQRKRPGSKQQDPPPPRRPGRPPKMVPPLRFPHLPLLMQTVIRADPSPPQWRHPAAEGGGPVEFG